MKKSQLKINIAIFFVIICSCFGCKNRFNKFEEVRTRLINNIGSYQTIDEFQKYLIDHSLKWKHEEKNLSTKDGTPPCNIYSITIKSYNHLGFFGELYICFFNNRLLEVRFYPKEFEKYLEVLAKTDNVILEYVKDMKNSGLKSDSNYIFIPLFTKFWVAEEYNNGKYIGWCDKRLDKEFNLWMNKYGD
jgi:hypothetical protein